MPDAMTCDICGRSVEELPPEVPAGAAPIELAADGLWFCVECGSKVRTAPVTAGEDEALSAELRPLIGQSAGAICRTLGLPYEPPYRAIIDAASAIAYDEDRYMSAWTFASRWLDGTTVWRSPDGITLAYRTPAESVQIRSPLDHF